MSINEVDALNARVTAVSAVTKTAFSILLALSVCHLLNDTVQSLIPAIYPILKKSYHLNFAQIGLITFTFQVSASLFQPLVGMYTDKRPVPYSLVIGMALTLTGLALAAFAGRFEIFLVAAGVIGLGSAVFHPESSRMARLASGGQHGLAQSLFQVGGNTGSSLGPLLAAFVVAPNGQKSLAWFTPLALLGMIILANVAAWYKVKLAASKPGSASYAKQATSLPKSRIILSLSILLALMFSKYVYLASISSYYTFYLIHKFHLSVQHAQLYLFLFLAAVALGAFVGGPVGDRIGRKYVIWASILGVLPFTLALPYATLPVTACLTVIIGFVLTSAFSAIIVYAQEMLPGRVGLISGLFFGFAFGIAGIGAAVLGLMADRWGITAVYRCCSYLPVIGLLAAFLPSMKKAKASTN
jgi:FSR family fosmidomycin resistance protein-like MFS transporter